MPASKGTKSKATPGGAAVRLVSVELTRRQRIALGLLIQKMAPGLMAAAHASDSLLRVVTAARSTVPLAESLLRASGAARSTSTTVKMHREAAEWWVRAIVMVITEPAFADWPAAVKLELAPVVFPLALAVTARRGKRPRLADADVSALVKRLGSRSTTRNAIRRAAAQLCVDEETVRRAVGRHDELLRARPATRLLLSE